jgi:hypothetical protein
LGEGNEYLDVIDRFQGKNGEMQGSPHLQKIGRLDFSLREHEEEVKA